MGPTNSLAFVPDAVVYKDAMMKKKLNLNSYFNSD